MAAVRAVAVGGQEPAATPSRVPLFGIEIDALDMAATVERCDELIRTGGYAQHMAINAAKAVMMEDDPKLRAIIRDCALVSADGQAVVWAARLLGTPLPERVAGIDLMHRLFELAEARGYSVFILGARQSTLDIAVERLRARHPSLELAGTRNGYFSDEEAPGVAETIRESRADIVLVAISSPFKEHFLGRYGPALGAPFVMGVGGAIDVLAGVTRRAPRIWQRLGIEWLYRLLQEPRRMFKRYAISNVRFMILVARTKVARARGA